MSISDGSGDQPQTVFLCYFGTRASQSYRLYSFVFKFYFVLYLLGISSILKSFMFLFDLTK